MELGKLMYIIKTTPNLKRNQLFIQKVQKIHLNHTWMHKWTKSIWAYNNWDSKIDFNYEKQKKCIPLRLWAGKLTNAIKCRFKTNNKIHRVSLYSISLDKLFRRIPTQIVFRFILDKCLLREQKHSNPDVSMSLSTNEPTRLHSILKLTVSAEHSTFWVGGASQETLQNVPNLTTHQFSGQSSAFQLI